LSKSSMLCTLSSGNEAEVIIPSSYIFFISQELSVRLELSNFFMSTLVNKLKSFIWLYIDFTCSSISGLSFRSVFFINCIFVIFTNPASGANIG
jgi:hypothetical protein